MIAHICKKERRLDFDMFSRCNVSARKEASKHCNEKTKEPGFCKKKAKQQLNKYYKQ